MSESKSGLTENGKNENWRLIGAESPRAPEWIEEALGAESSAALVPGEASTVLLLAREGGLVLPLLLSASTEALGIDERLKVEEAIARTRLENSLALEELDSVLFILLGARIPVAVGGSLGLQLSLPIEQSDRSPAEEVDLWVSRERMNDALRALGRAGYRVAQDVGPFGVGHEVLLSKETGRASVRLRRAFGGVVPDHISAQTMDHALASSMRTLPRQAMRLSATELMFQFLMSFNDMNGPRSIQGLYLAKVLLGSSLRDEVDWIRLAKSLGASGCIGNSVAGFFILERRWATPLGSPIAELVAKRSTGLTGEVLRSWFSPAEIIRHRTVPAMRRIVGRATALRETFAAERSERT